MSWFKSNRLGRFEIEADVIDEVPEAVLRVMGTVIVISARMLPHKRAVEYIGMSEHFDEYVEAGEMPPLYDMGYDEETHEVSWTLAEGK